MASFVGVEHDANSVETNSVPKRLRLVCGKYGFAFCGIKRGLAFLGRCRRDRKRKADGTGMLAVKKRKVNRVGLVYHRDMEKHCGALTHPERPDRLKAIWALLCHLGINRRCIKVEAKEVEESIADFTHSDGHFKCVDSIVIPLLGGGGIYEYRDMFWNDHTSRAARLAAGSVVEITDRVMRGELHSGFALVRPPGHHAGHKAEGFCWFNNVAIAASHAQKEFGVKKIMIVDWDVHHGNGTQDIFYSNPNVLYLSLHRFGGGFYPGTGAYDEGGDVGCEGTNLNIPWPYGNMGDVEYVAAFERIVLPVAKEFDPEVIFVSAGFDAAINDPLGGMNVTPACFGWMTTQLMTNNPNAKIVMALEGGYNLESISKAAYACICALLEDEPPYIMPHVAAKTRNPVNTSKFDWMYNEERGPKFSNPNQEKDKSGEHWGHKRVTFGDAQLISPGKSSEEESWSPGSALSHSSTSAHSPHTGDALQQSPSSTSSSSSSSSDASSASSHGDSPSPVQSPKSVSSESSSGSSSDSSESSAPFSLPSSPSSSASSSSSSPPPSLSPSACSASSSVSSSSSSSPTSLPSTSSSSSSSESELPINSRNTDDVNIVEDAVEIPNGVVEIPPPKNEVPGTPEPEPAGLKGFQYDSESDDEWQIEWGAEQTLNAVVNFHSRFYKCFESIPEEEDDEGEDNSDDERADAEALDFFGGLGVTSKFFNERFDKDK